MVRLPCGVQARTAALLFRADYARLPDCAAVESFTAELGRCVLAPQGKRVTLAYCELAALWTCEKATPAVAALLLILSLLMLRLAAPVNDINIHFDSNEMQALCTGMQKRLAVYAVISSMAFFVQPQAFGVLSASACVVALCVLFARMGLGITVIQ